MRVHHSGEVAQDLRQRLLDNPPIGLQHVEQFAETHLLGPLLQGSKTRPVPEAAAHLPEPTRLGEPLWLEPGIYRRAILRTGRRVRLREVLPGTAR